MVAIGAGTTIGIATIPPFPDWENPTNYTPYLGMNFLTTVEVYDIDPQPRTVIPDLGQLWPRKVWQYNDDYVIPTSILGFAKLWHFFYTGVIIETVMSGQLWPRGDYVANAERK